jgi:hypothetical protein
MKLRAALFSTAWLFSAGIASAQTTPSGEALKPDQCGTAWDKSVIKGDAAALTGASGSGGNFAQVDDVFQVDSNQDGTIDKQEFMAACTKGLVYAPRSGKE